MPTDPIAPTLDYAGRGIIEPARLWPFKASVWLAGVSAAVGLLILGGYAVSGVDAFVGLGGIWLAVGGLASFCAFIFGAIYASSCLRRRDPKPGRVALATLLPIANIGLAVGCVWAGAQLMEYHAHFVIITNEGQTRIDRVDLTSPSFTRSLGPLEPGRTISVHYPERHSETLSMLVTIGVQSTPYTVADSMSTSFNFGPRYVKLDGLNGYKNREGVPPP